MLTENQIREIPMRVHWAGMEGNTYSMRREGWEIFASEELERFRYEKVIRLGLKDPTDKIMLHGFLKIPMEYLASRTKGGLIEFFRSTWIDLGLYRATDTVRVDMMDKYTWGKMDELSLSDGFAHVQEEYHDIKELKLFKMSEEKAKQIIISEASIDQCMNQILKIQHPIQQEIKRNMKVEEIKKPIIQAKIYALAA